MQRQILKPVYQIQASLAKFNTQNNESIAFLFNDVIGGCGCPTLRGITFLLLRLFITASIERRHNCQYNDIQKNITRTIFYTKCFCHCYGKCCNTVCHYALSRCCIVILLRIVMLGVLMLSVIAPTEHEED